MYAAFLPDKDERLRRNHSIEWAYRWQYAITFHLLRGITPNTVFTEAPAVLRVPPDGPGWEINVDYAHGRRGYEAVTPIWCTDGTAVIERLHWRRPSPDMEFTDLNQNITVNRNENQ